MKSLLVLQNFTIARKSGNILLAYRQNFSSDTRQKDLGRSTLYKL